MALHDSLLIALVQLIDAIPLRPPPKPRRGHPYVYSDRLFLKALVIMILRPLATVHAVLVVLEQPTPEMRQLRCLLTEHSRYPSRRTFEWRLNTIPESLPAQIGCLGRHLVAVIQPFHHAGRAAALDSTILRVRGGVWHKKPFASGTILVYQLALLYRFEHGLDLNLGLKPFLQAA